ncbi:hypothetical protein [Hymenobacter guriensis]|uniref:Uncharacterized protein n=1 Tax=Hymenobacter guriensis TaxID=2793065 RepID=A0ABS0KYY1_9BACT|nr:hypothetical protein [Hymenobacter guriensis]MBG8553072.1 hypothetical protein [Hymenobacter guriensis]
MYQIRSTYTEWAAEYDDNPSGRVWAGQYETYAGAWAAVRDHLFAGRWELKPSKARPSELGLAPYGHEEPTAFYGQTIIENDAETIEIREF